MSPTVATLLTILAVAFLLWREAAACEVRSPALWLPVFWLCVTGSRFVSQWMSLGSSTDVAYSDGSAVDALYFLTLIVAAFWVLVQRQVRLGEVIANNKWLFALVAYGLISIAWSDFPFIALKRWIKTLGHPLMALVILTEPNPTAAVRTVFKRCSFFLLLFSVLFIKYLPEYGRGFDGWSGQAFNNGIGVAKNELGQVCMVFGIFFIWNLLTLKRYPDGSPPLKEIAFGLGFLGIDLWLLVLADSATSKSTMALGVVTMLALGWRIVSKRYFGTFVVFVLLTAVTIESAFNVYAQVLALLGRNPSLTDRTIVWADVLALQDQPIFGFGFESFWLGRRLDILWAKWWWKPNQAHNGYIETYLNLGGIGVFLLFGMLASTFHKISKQLLTDLDFARLRFAFLFAIVAFNYTEATFKAVHFIWTIFYIFAMDYPKRDSLPTEATRRYEWQQLK